jgi:ankyrin repeat protein
LLKLIDANCALNLKNKNGENVLMLAIMENKQDLALEFIERTKIPKENLNLIDSHGESLLMLALENNMKKVATTLLEYGCELDVENNDINALFIALENDQTEIAIQLIEFGANINFEHPKLKELVNQVKKDTNDFLDNLYVMAGPIVYTWLQPFFARSDLFPIDNIRNTPRRIQCCVII